MQQHTAAKQVANYDDLTKYETLVRKMHRTFPISSLGYRACSKITCLVFKVRLKKVNVESSGSPGSFHVLWILWAANLFSHSKCFVLFRSAIWVVKVLYSC